MKYNGKIISVMVCICAMFLVLAVYLTHFTLFEAEEITDNKYNRRIREREEKILRGSIYDANGEVLAYSIINDEWQTRYYPFGSRYTHVVGYNSVTYGKTGIESTFNDMLVKTDPMEDISNLFSVDESSYRGADLYLTLDNSLTAVAERLMAGKNGAVVALKPDTGEVLCLFSNPGFDVNSKSLKEKFSILSQSENAPFVGRAAQGLYPPGSTFKIITSVAALEEGLTTEIEDTGTVIVDGYEVKNYGGKEMGLIDIKEGFAKSSNVMFAKYGEALGEKKLKETARRFGIGEQIDFDTATSKSMFNYEEKMTKTDLAACGIGQGKLLVTPLNMALVAAGIANDGVIMEPYIVERAVRDKGKIVYVRKPKVWKTAVSPSVADTITEYMVYCVEEGTGRGAKLEGVSVAGKTGTAENEIEGKEHAWFVCFAPCENPEIAICVMQEHTGLTGSSCAPIAKELIEYYLNK